MMAQQSRTGSPEQTRSHLALPPPWQKCRRSLRTNDANTTKKRKIETTTQINTHNRFAVLESSNDAMEIVEPPPNQQSQRIPPPPPIFVDDVIDMQTMIKSLERDISKEDYNLKISNNKVKILPTNPEAYRKLTKILRTLNANFHTYQLKQERPFRVVLRNIHHSADIDELKYELSKLGHEVINALTPLTSAPNHRKPQRNASTVKGTILPTTKAAQPIKHYTRTDDTALLATHADPVIASSTLQRSLDSMEKWFHKWGFNINEKKSSHVTFTLRKQTCPQVTINNATVPSRDTVRYLGMILDRRLMWKKHISDKTKQLKDKLKKLYWLTGRRSKLNIQNKITLYKTVIKPEDESPGHRTYPHRNGIWPGRIRLQWQPPQRYHHLFKLHRGLQHTACDDRNQRHLHSTTATLRIRI
ncbi:uncharacterized protein LOC126875913 [Bombus huntii]|uniref:uncharacterized protein LOC126875913 n=1 Tax=Bombus huntii TaxID=85661 RepID=UPI0021AA2CF1|nr:uncharacterized protein LOC126875913 [Bombus huntii]